MLKKMTAVTIALSFFSFTAKAADGSFLQTAAATYSWDTAGNWTGGTIADGSGSTATFSSGTTGTINVTLDSNHTIGNFVFSAHAWNIQGPNVLTLAGPSTPTFNISGPGATISASVAGTQGLTLSTGLLTLSGSNNYSGTTTVAGASYLTVNNSNALGSTTDGTTVASGAQLVLLNTTITGETATISGGGNGTAYGALQGRGTSTWTGNIALGNGSSRIGTFDALSQLTVSGVISGSQPLFISGLGTTILTGANTYTGMTQIYRGTLKLDGGNDRLPTGTLLMMGGTADTSVFDLNGRNQQVSGLANGTNTSSRTLTNSSATASTLTLNGTTDRSFIGTGTTAISGNLSVVKGGTYNQTLANSNSYTGNTTVNTGTLTLADDTTMTFYIGANGINNGISGSGTLNLNGDFIFDLTGAAAVNGNSWNIVNVATLTETFSSTFTLQGFSESANIWTSGNYTFSEATGVLSYSAVPEPSTYLLLLGGISILGLLCRKDRKAIRS